MDSITHIVIGASIGEIFVGRQLKRKALWWGMVAQSLPDIDFLASFWSTPAQDLLAHRGFTHSLLFAMIAAVFCGLLAEKVHRKHNISLKSWIIFFGLQILIHLFIDSMNAYGTGLLEPFSHKRFSFNVIFVADPFFSIWAALALIAVFIFRTHKNKTHWAIIALSMSGAYLLYCVANKLVVERKVKNILSRDHIAYKRHFTTPTMLNSWLWNVVAENDSGYYIGYYSIFSKTDNITWQYRPRNEQMIAGKEKEEDLHYLLRFSQGYYTVERWEDTLVFNDLRFGQIAGWRDTNARFVFHYFLGTNADNDLVVQRGRMAMFNKRDIGSLIEKIKGN